MKIWYQSMTREDGAVSYNRVLRGVIDKTRDTETKIEIHGLRRTGGIADQYLYLEHLAAVEVMDNVQQAVRDGFDAFLIGNIADPGLAACKEIANIPVLGLCESTIHMACMMGARFSLVTLNEKFTSRILDNVARYELKGRLASVARMRIENIADLEAGLSDKSARDRIVEEFLQAANGAVADGAEVVIPAGGILMALLFQAGIILADDGAPILNGISALVKTGEMAVKMDRLMGGHYMSKRLTYKPPLSSQIVEIRSRYGNVYPTVKGPV